MIRFAPLTRSDVNAAKRVIATVVLEYYFDGLSVDELLERYETSGYLADFDHLELNYEGEKGLLLGVFEEGTLVGTGGVKRTDEESGELVRMWLMRDFRGRGIGRQMMEQLILFARNAQWRRLRLDTSLRCKEAVGLFRKVGFREIPPYKQSIGDCFMELQLS